MQNSQQTPKPNLQQTPNVQKRSLIKPTTTNLAIPTNEPNRTQHPPTSLSLNPDLIKPSQTHQRSPIKAQGKPKSQQTQLNPAPTISFSKPRSKEKAEREREIEILMREREL